MSGLNNYQKYLIEAAYKSLKGKPNTSSLTSWYEENGELKHRVDLSSIWIDADNIPLEAPSLEANDTYTIDINSTAVPVLKYYKKIKLSKIAGTKASFYNSNLIDSIDSSYGTGYTAKLYDNKDNVIPFGLNKWVIDSESGVLTFIDGIPDGYILPLYISFYQYVGRKGNNTLLKSDGTVVMDKDYIPTNDKSIATKEYVDNSKSVVNDILKKLIPNTPETFKGKDIELLNTTRKGKLVTTTDNEVDVVYSDDYETIGIRLPKTWDQEQLGYLTIYINDNKLYVVKLLDIFNGKYNKNIITDIKVEDSYSEKIIADEFYKSYTLTASINISLQIMPFISSLDYPIVRIRAEWSNGDENKYSTNDLIIGLDLSSKAALISNPYLSDMEYANAYISGVPSLVENDKFTIINKLNTLKRFRKDIHGKCELEGLEPYDITTKSVYTSTNPIIENYKEITIPSGIYSETMNFHLESYNLDSEINCKKDFEYRVRIDSKSNEINRVTSPKSDGTGFGDIWSLSKCKEDLHNSNELQMLGGQYQWPRGDYTNNGNNIYISTNIPSGPKYDDIDSGIRYVTLSYDLKNSSGFYFTIKNSEGLEIDPDNFIIKNISSLKCHITGKEDWLDMNQPYDGVLNPFDLENKGCLVVDKSNETTKYCTFGTEVLSGTLLICLGIPYNLNIKISGFDISSNI